MERGEQVGRANRMRRGPLGRMPQPGRTTVAAVAMVTAFLCSGEPTTTSFSAAAPLDVPVTAAPVEVPRTHLRPVDGEVLRAAEIPEQNWLPGHRGVDLGARPGATIRSSGAGTVRFAGVVAGTPVVSVDHGDGLVTTYEPVLAGVSQGDAVSRGQVLGRLADAATLPETARRDPGLSWGARFNDRYIDPMSLLGSLRVRLWD